MESISSQFQGAGGALIVSGIAFTIVFVVLMGLTAVIYAIKFFAGSDNPQKGQGTPAAPSTPAPVVVQVPAAPAPSAGSKSQITAAITAAILATVGGQARILGITPVPSQAGGVAPAPRTTWKTTGIVERVGGRLSRSWKH